MIPLKLQLKNFLSYGADIQTIDFTPYSLICLSGKNGHGKSALLDAMTWALWGQGRKIAGVAKSDDNLVRIGQTHMMVGMQFICNGQEYRVRREYTKSSNKPYATLDVGVFDPGQNSFIPIGGKSIRSNQAALEQIVHLDFDTFCNSAFLRQGQSNEFSKKSPKERKEILASILGLDQYESIRALASEHARAAATSRISFQAILDRMLQDLEHIKTIDERLQEVQEKFVLVNGQESFVAKREKEVEEHHVAVRDDQQQRQIIEMQINELQKNEKELQQPLLELVDTWRAVHAQQLKVPAFSDLERKKKQLVDQLQTHQQAMHASLMHKEQYLHQKELLQRFEADHAQIIAARIQEDSVKLERIKIELEHYKGAIVACDKRTCELLQENKTTEQALNSLLDRQKKMTVDSKAYEALVKQFEKRKAYYQNWITLGNLLTGEIQNLDRKKQLSQDETNPCCPLCEQNLSSSRRRFLKDKFMREEQFLKHKILRITRVVQKLKVLLIEQHAQLERLNNQKDEAQKIAVQIDGAKAKQLSIAQEIEVCGQQKLMCDRQAALFVSSIANQEKELQAVEVLTRESLKQDPDYRQAIDQLQSLEKSAAAHLYDVTKHDLLRTELEHIEKLIKSHEELTKQIGLQEAREAQIHALVVRLKKVKQELSALHEQKKRYESVVQQEIELIEQEQELIKIKTTLKQNKEALLHEKGGLERERTKLKALEQESAGCQKQIADINGRIDDYQAIATATGKDGIQALLIQDILPEIEQEANELLAKLTDNQAQIFIESLRDLKKGGAKETLDINISDTMGIRPYEMFSGGEAFRIDFALRIALSKMLARRAGTSLQTLIIDEGFGSQDEEGLAHIMDALYRIQDDFAKIIIVSHLPSMKDQFPVHFHIEKKPSGSVINIIEQG